MKDEMVVECCVAAVNAAIAFIETLERRNPDMDSLPDRDAFVDAFVIAAIKVIESRKE